VTPTTSDDGTGDDGDGVFIDASGGLTSAPSLSMVTANVFPVDARVVQILAADGADLAGIRLLQEALFAVGATAHVIAPHKGAIKGAGRRADELTVDRSYHTASSAEGDAIVIAHGTAAITDPAIITFIQSAYRHCKPVAAWGDGTEMLASAGIAEDAPGVVSAAKANKTFAKDVISSMGVHRHWDRLAPHPTRRPADEPSPPAAKKSAAPSQPTSKKGR